MTALHILCGIQYIKLETCGYLAEHSSLQLHAINNLGSWTDIFRSVNEKINFNSKFRFT